MSLYGTTPESRIADPADPTRIFTWLLAESWDNRGNVILYSYKAEDGEGVDCQCEHEINRRPEARATNRLIKRIRYGNRTPIHDRAELRGVSWMFEVVFDYGDHADSTPTPGDTEPWPVRLDPFSAYRAGFEVRSYRRCRRILMFHHFPEETGVGSDCLVRALSLFYDDEREERACPEQPVASLLSAVRLTGYRREARARVGLMPDAAGVSCAAHRLPGIAR